MTMFLGTHPSRIDNKGRLSLPAFFLTVLKRQHANQYESAILRLSHLHTCFEERISLPKNLKQHVSLADVTVFMGLRRFFKSGPLKPPRNGVRMLIGILKISQLPPSHLQKEARG